MKKCIFGLILVWLCFSIVYADKPQGAIGDETNPGLQIQQEWKEPNDIGVIQEPTQTANPTELQMPKQVLFLPVPDQILCPTIDNIDEFNAQTLKQMNNQLQLLEMKSDQETDSGIKKDLQKKIRDLKKELRKDKKGKKGKGNKKEED